MAEYLAHGYVISDQILAKAIAADQGTLILSLVAIEIDHSSMQSTVSLPVSCPSSTPSRPTSRRLPSLTSSERRPSSLRSTRSRDSVTRPTLVRLSLHPTSDEGVSLTRSTAAIIGSKYYQHALSSPFGVKVHSFYTSTTKQVLDVRKYPSLLSIGSELTSTRNRRGGSEDQGEEDCRRGRCCTRYCCTRCHSGCSL